MTIAVGISYQPILKRYSFVYCTDTASHNVTCSGVEVVVSLWNQKTVLWFIGVLHQLRVQNILLMICMLPVKLILYLLMCQQKNPLSWPFSLFYWRMYRKPGDLPMLTMQLHELVNVHKFELSGIRWKSGINALVYYPEAYTK